MNQKEYRRRRKEDAKKAYAALMKYYPFTLDDLDGEVWKSATYCADYLVSNFGRTKSFKNRKVKILKPVLDGRGYLCVNLHKDNKMKSSPIHRLVAQTFIPNPEGKPEVNHLDGHPMNNFVGNLEWATASENSQHAYDTGLKVAPQGENHVEAKLTSEQAEYVRLNPDGLTCAQLAEQFGVDKTTISHVQIGKKYKNVGGTVRKAQKRSLNVTEETKRQIRASWATGQYTKAALARQYGYAQSTIGNILREV